MAEACRSFVGGVLPTGIAGTVAPLAISSDLALVARVFRETQQQRHRADYDLARPFSRNEVLQLIQEVERALAAWQRVRGTDVACFFLMALLVWNRISRS